MNHREEDVFLAFVLVLLAVIAVTTIQIVCAR